MEELLEKAGKVSDQAEIFYIEESEDTLNFENSQIKDIDSKIQSGYSIRIIKDGKVGFACTKNLNDREILIQNAQDSLKAGVEGDFKFPASNPDLELDTYNGEIEECDTDKIVEEGYRIMGKLKEKTDGQVNMRGGKRTRKIRIINSSGTDLETEHSFYKFSVQLLYPGSYSSVKRMIVSRKFKEFPEKDIEYISNLYNRGREEVSIKSGKMKVLFLPEVLYVLLWRILSGTNGKNIYEKQSPLINRVGDKIFSDKLSILDDPRNDRRAGARAFDDEGTPTEKLNLIENGILRNYYCDLKYASRLDLEPTGSGYKNTRWGGDTVTIKPSPSLMHLCINKGDYSFEELISDMDRGVIVGGALGAHSGNIQSGEYSVGLSPGIYIENGEIKGRVKDVMVAGNIYNDLEKVLALEDKLHRGMMGVYPSVLLDEISVASKG